MNTDELRTAILSPKNGIIGLVESLLTASKGQAIQLSWESGQCHVKFSEGDKTEEIAIPIRKSVFRAALARIAVLCNEKKPNSVSPYGGEGELSIGFGTPMTFKVIFANTLETQQISILEELTGTDMPVHSISSAVGTGIKNTIDPNMKLGVRKLRENGWPKYGWVAAAAVLLVSGFVGATIFNQRNVQRLTFERDQARSELERLRQRMNFESPLKFTGDRANHRIDWSKFLASVYDPSDTASANLGRIEKLGGDGPRERIAGLRKQKPELTEDQILRKMLDWQDPQ